LVALGISAFLVAIFMAIFAIVDVLNEYLVGYLSDKSTRFTKRWGKRFVFIIGGGFGTAITLLLIFLPIWETKPEGGLINPGQTLLAILWLSIAISIWDTVQTVEELNSRAITPDLIRDPKSRAKLQMAGTTLGTLSLVIGIILIPLLISIFGGETSPYAFFMMALIIGLIYIVIFLPIRAYGIKEPKEMREFRHEFDIIKKEKEPLWNPGKRALKSGNFMSFVIAYLAYGLTMRMLTLGFDLYTVHVLELDIAYASLPLLGVVAGAFITGLLSYVLLRKFGSKNTFQIGSAIIIFGFFLMIFSTSILTLTLFSFIVGLGIGFHATSRGLMSIEAIDKDTLRYGKREEAQYYAINQIFSATGKFWSAVIFALIVAIFAYDPTLGAKNTPTAKFGLLLYISIIPMMIFIAAALFVWKFFNITKEMAAENKEKLLKLGH
jgi:GPH family glycoside/pentoside/hexuronide:cation symporter